ncbi:hypothetical protein BU16DRAFT_451729 [Lophium mytilinum]|uniref:Aminoglycoside phosphotransferase domain-containing protein n=1 Tax=Lophium mytilinum TaxID=390894 RepID=A0A6A6RBA1_9PEZI|nr:hypothetical protein BU16DRAFT_451729 [Lophium mytilinum]
MTRPSEHWHNSTNLSPGSEKYKRIQLILSSANLEHLEKRAVDSRRRHQTDLSPDVGCSIDPARFTSGFDNLILELAFSDTVYWVARIPYRTVDADTKTMLLSEIATMKTIRQRTTIPVPMVFDFEMSKDQPFGYPYVLMECIDGRSLDNGMALSIPPQHRIKVARQFANVFVELQNLTFDRIGRLWCGENADQAIEIIPMAWHHSPGPLETSFEYFYNQRQGENREIMTLHPHDPDWRTACWVLKTALAHIIIEDRIRGPFPLCHLDLHYGNLLFDDEYNLTGVIDWSSAQAAPIEQLSVSPEFITFPGLSAEENRPIIEFKKRVMRFMKEMESEVTASPLIHQQGNMKQSNNSTYLSNYMASKSAEIAHRQYMASPRSGLWAGKVVAKLIYGTNITWEQLREVYGTMPLL